jgi:hypothetical protein
MAIGRRYQPKPGDASRKVHTARANARAAMLAPIIAELQAAGATSLRELADGLNRSGILTASGRGDWQATQVRRLLARLKAGARRRASV